MGKTWYTVKDGKIKGVQITPDDGKPLPESKDWKLSSNDLIHPGDPIDRYDDNMCRLSDEAWLKKCGRKDSRGRWYNKDNPGETKLIYNIDEIAGDDWTQEPPIEDEPYQKFDKQKNKWVVDTEKKEAAEKENNIAQIQSSIDDAERRIQRSTRAKLIGDATADDERYFTEINAEIIRLREEKQQLLSA